MQSTTENGRAVAAQDEAPVIDLPMLSLATLETHIRSLKDHRAELRVRSSTLMTTLKNERSAFARAGLSSADWTGNLRGSDVEWASMKRCLQNIKTEETAILSLETVQRRLRAEIFAKLAEFAQRVRLRAEIFGKLAEFAQHVRAAPGTRISSEELEPVRLQRRYLDLVDARLVTAYRGLKLLQRQLLETKARRETHSDYAGDAQAARERVQQLEQERSRVMQELADVGQFLAITEAHLTARRIESVWNSLERVHEMARAIEDAQ